MSDDINTAASVAEFLVARANAKAGLSLDPDEVTFAPPALLDATVVDFSDPAKRNSSVQLTRPADGNGPAVDVTVVYNRLSMAKLFNLRSTEFPYPGDGVMLSSMLNQINARLGTRLVAEDIIDAIVVEGPMSLEADPDSLYVFGEIEISFGESSGGEPEG
ncbi:hypothetical protein LUCX_274 [Xanthomonas phage vB_XciM_LucasX]|nr:hypothetical protein LUCX_274 [Xanthomonas phage vB_XciM_LucasX]